VFIRKKQNNIGSISVQVLQKQKGKNVLLHSVGSSFDDTEISNLLLQAKVWINNQSGAELDFDNTEQLFSKIMNNILSLKPVGTNIILGRIFDEIGFPPPWVPKYFVSAHRHHI
jgi:hypothetical protein